MLLANKLTQPQTAQYPITITGTLMRNHLLRLMLIVIFTILPSACSYLSTNRQPDDPAHLSAIEYYHWLNSASIEDLNKERLRLESVNPEDTYSAYIQLALLLSAPASASSSSEQQALSLLMATDQRSEFVEPEEDYFLLATLWRVVLEQRQRLRKEVAAKEEQQIEVTKLEEKIEALTHIEQQLMEREQYLPEE